MKLRETDRHAVDLLLDRGQSSMVREGGPGYAAFSGPLTQRVRHVEKLLNLLDELPTEEPPEGLMAALLERLKDRSTSAVGGASNSSALVEPQHPVL